jgi:hypothetical protein
MLSSQHLCKVGRNEIVAHSRGKSLEWPAHKPDGSSVSKNLRKREQSLLMILPKPSMLLPQLAIIAVLLHASAVLSEESSRDAGLPTGDVWGSVEPLLEDRAVPMIEWLPLLPDGSIDHAWLRRERSEQHSCARKPAEGSAAATSYRSVEC